MPHATASWLVDNTALSFEQIAEFCGLHALEVQGIADDEVAIGIQGLTVSEIGARLGLAPNTVSTYRARILEKTGAKNDVELALYAERHRSGA